MRALILLSSISLLSGCGANLCVGGVGTCDHIWDKFKERASTTTSGTLSISKDAPSVMLGGKVRFKAAGGAPPYTWSVLPQTGVHVGQIANDGNDGVYTAPHKILSGTQVIVTVKVVDRNNATGDQSISVTSN